MADGEDAEIRFENSAGPAIGKMPNFGLAPVDPLPFENAWKLKFLLDIRRPLL